MYSSRVEISLHIAINGEKIHFLTLPFNHMLVIEMDSRVCKLNKLNIVLIY